MITTRGASPYAVTLATREGRLGDLDPGDTFGARLTLV